MSDSICHFCMYPWSIDSRDFQIGKTKWFHCWSTRNQIFPAITLKTKPWESLIVHRVYGVTHVVTFQKVLQHSHSGKHLSLSILKYFDHFKPREFQVVCRLYGVTLLVAFPNRICCYCSVLRLILQKTLALYASSSYNSYPINSSAYRLVISFHPAQGYQIASRSSHFWHLLSLRDRQQ